MTGDGLTSTSALLPRGLVLTVAAGVVNVFVAERRDSGTGAWVLVIGVTGPATMAGADVSGAELIVSPLPGAEYGIGVQATVDEDAVEETRGRAEAVLVESRIRTARKQEADLLQEQHDAWLVGDALTDLTDSVPGHAQLTSGETAPEVAAVHRLAGYVGLPADPVRLRRAVTDAQVSGRDRIAALAAACDASMRRLELPPDWWRVRGSAFLVRTASDDSLSVAHWSRGGYRIWNPVSGQDERVTADSAALLARTGLLLQPLLDPNRPASLRELMRRSTRGNGSSFAMLLFTTVVVGLLSAVIPVVSGLLTTSVAASSTTRLAAVGLALVFVVIAITAIKAVRSFALTRIRTQLTSTAAAAVWDRQLRLPMTWHKARTQGGRMADSTAVDMASMSASDGVITSLLDTATVLGAVLGAFIVNAWVALTIIVILVIRGVVEMGLVRRQVRLAAEVVEDDAGSPMIELLRGVNRLRASGAISRAYAKWAIGMAPGVTLAVRQGRVQTALSVSGALWPSLGLAMMLAVIAVTMPGTSDDQALGALVTAQTALTVANSALASAIASVAAGLSALAILRRAMPILEALPESAGGGEVAPLSGGIDLRGIVYRYAPELPPIFNQLNLEVAPGEHLALVGPSGTGKTTLLRLLLGLDDPEAGLVAFDGRDLTGLDRSAVRRQIGAVMQSSALLPGSVRENVDLGRGLTGAEIWGALDQAAVGEDVRAMPMGLNTVVIEGGAGISGGQRQRILLARALAGSPRILVLDEATSALDNVSQAAVVANLDRLRVTRIVVAHRLSTIQRADRIAVLTEGRIVQQGTFDELVSVPGPFRILVERQSVDALAP